MEISPSAWQVIAPGLLEQPWSEAEALGSAVWLWMHSATHRAMPLHTLSALLLPAIQRRQFVVVVEAGRPVFYVAWANLDEAGERRYLEQHPILMPASDWNSGDRMWILDWVAPFGHSHAMAHLLKRQLWANRCAYYLYHRGDGRGLKVKQFSGRALLSAEVRDWFATHPVVLPAFRPTPPPEERTL